MSVIVGYIHPRPGIHTGNLRWLGRFAPIRGRFPATHPAAPNSPVFSAAGGGQCGDSPMLEAWRARAGLDETLEILCTKAGDGSLGVDGELLSLKEAKPLPASD